MSINSTGLPHPGDDETSELRRQELTVDIRPWGPDQETLQRAARAILEHPAVRQALKDARYRLLNIQAVEPEAETKPRELPDRPPDHYRATIYDYSNKRTLFVDGRLGDLDDLQITESGLQPLPDAQEYQEAIQILYQDAELGPALREHLVQPYFAMPPLLETEQPDGTVERTLTVGLMPQREGAVHEIVGVNMIRQAVIRFDGRAPAGVSLADGQTCGLPDANQATTSQGTAGQVQVTVTQGGTVLWRFLAVRPAASSGTRGSGIELRFVDYRGKRVLYRAHVPILNVKYDPGGCGCYRDWQYQEGMIQASGSNVAPGFLLCPAPAQTILDSGSDQGTFLGTAIYVQGLEAVLVCEMQAGWYRYVSEWRFHANGTIRPRFGFSAVQSSCVCHIHHHHVYWRLDFDIRTAGNNRVREYNNPPIFPNTNWHTKIFEIQRPRDPSRNRKWRVENTVSGEGYDIIPGKDDGVATASPDWPFPRGDVWVLRYHGNEIDDGVNSTASSCEAQLNNFLNGEPVNNQDVVIWYGAHFTHNVAAEPPGVFGEIVGPTLEPVNWG